jgi:hypothetical protein
MNRRKQFRAVATRFDKLADRYQATSPSPTSSSGYGPDPTGPDAIQETRPNPKIDGEWAGGSTRRSAAEPGPNRAMGAGQAAGCRVTV